MVHMAVYYLTVMQKSHHTHLPWTYLCGRKSQVCQLFCELFASFWTIVCHI